MLLFCPTCSNVLTVTSTSKNPSHDDDASNRLKCTTCPYQFVLEKRYYERKTFPKKERDDVFGGKGAWDDAQKARVQCTKTECVGLEVAFYQVQIRSADEPMTSFYKCMTCGHRWREN